LRLTGVNRFCAAKETTMAKRKQCRCHAAAAGARAAGSVRRAQPLVAAATPGLAELIGPAGPGRAPGAVARLSGPGWLQAQRLLGNLAVAREVRRLIAQRRSSGAAEPSRLQRKKLTDAEKAQDLQSDALKNSPRLQQAFDDAPLLSAGETSEGVQALQRALVKLGYPLPISFAKTGDADGIFGSETRKALVKFQTDQTLVYKDGIAGRETLGAMDRLLGTAPPPPAAPCHFVYQGGAMTAEQRSKFLQDHFEARDRSPAALILDDLCAVEKDRLSFDTEDALRDEVMVRLRVSQHMKESQTSGGFAYPESAKDCPGKTGNALLDAQVNVDARAYWNGPILEQRAVVKNQHYFFELTPDVGMKDGYQALKLLFDAKPSVCDRTLIHCDTLITMTKAMAYAETIGIAVFNQKIASGQLSMWLTYDGMSIRDNDKASTPVSAEFRYVVPSSEGDMVIGDHVVFWNHLAYDAISVRNPGPWRLENALIVDKDKAGQDLFEGHGAPATTGAVKPGPKADVHTELMKAYNPYAKDALSITQRVDAGDATASADLAVKYPQVVAGGGRWWIKELDSNASRAQRFHELRELTGPDDPAIVGLRNPDDVSKLGAVQRPVQSS
jgi:Putative peptidoglycan binding domain